MREEMQDSAPLTVICNRLNLKGTRGAETSAKVNGPIFARYTDLHEPPPPPPCFSRRCFSAWLSDPLRPGAPLNGSAPEIGRPPPNPTTASHSARGA